MDFESQKPIEGKFVSSIMYRGNGVVSIMLRENSTPEPSSSSINLIGCLDFQDSGVVGNKITQAGIRTKTMVHIYILQRYEGNGKDYYTYEILDDQDNWFIALAEEIIVSEDPHLYSQLS